MLSTIRICFKKFLVQRRRRLKFEEEKWLLTSSNGLTAKELVSTNLKQETPGVRILVEWR